MRRNRQPRKKAVQKIAGQRADDGMLRVTAGRFLLEMPRPRLPSWIGTPNLRAGLSVYPRVDLDVPIATTNASVAAGAIAQVINIDSSLIPNFASRFGATFKEFAIVGARFEIRVTDSTNPQGLVLGFIDEVSNAAPTTTSADYAHCEIPLVGSVVDSSGSMHVIEWVAKSYADLTWDGIGTSGVVAYLKLWASSTAGVGYTGTTNTTAATMMVSGSYAVCFRGYI